MSPRKPKKGARHDGGRLPRRLFKRERAPAIPGGSRVVPAPAGQARMSEVLETFVAPYRGLADTEEAFRNLLNLGMLAWNAALLPEDKRRAMLDETLAAGFSRASEAQRAQARGLVEDLIRRKEQHFADNQRAIVSFNLTDTGHEYRLFVASTL